MEFGRAFSEEIIGQQFGHNWLQKRQANKYLLNITFWKNLENFTSLGVAKDQNSVFIGTNSLLKNMYLITHIFKFTLLLKRCTQLNYTYLYAKNIISTHI